MGNFAPAEESDSPTHFVTGLAIRLGAVEAGVAPLDRFCQERAPMIDNTGSYLSTGYSPQELLPEARSVLVIAVRVPNGVLASSVTPLETTHAFGNFGYVHLNRLLNQITYEVACSLEDRGWNSLPLGACGSVRCDLGAYEEGRTIGPLHGIFNLKQAAVLAGVGRRARSGLIATPRHGTRVRLGAVITTATLTGSPLLQGTPCPPHCGICIASCPMNAITTEGHVNHVDCFSDNGRRGTTESEILDQMNGTFPGAGATSGYLPHENAAIDGFGNRECRAVCMALCPLWKTV